MTYVNATGLSSAFNWFLDHQVICQDPAAVERLRSKIPDVSENLMRVPIIANIAWERLQSNVTIMIVEPRIRAGAGRHRFVKDNADKPSGHYSISKIHEKDDETGLIISSEKLLGDMLHILVGHGLGDSTHLHEFSSYARTIPKALKNQLFRDPDIQKRLQNMIELFSDNLEAQQIFRTIRDAFESAPELIDLGSDDPRQRVINAFEFLGMYTQYLADGTLKSLPNAQTLESIISVFVPTRPLASGLTVNEQQQLAQVLRKLLSGKEQFEYVNMSRDTAVGNVFFGSERLIREAVVVQQEAISEFDPLPEYEKDPYTVPSVPSVSLNPNEGYFQNMRVPIDAAGAIWVGVRGLVGL